MKSMVFAALIFSVLTTVAAPQPSRPPLKGCRWEKFHDPAVGLEAWVQRCDFGFRKIVFLANEHSLAIQYSDGGGPEPVVDVLDLAPGENARSGIQRIFDAHTDKTVARRCVFAPYKETDAPPAGVKRYTFVPDAAYRKELDRQADPNSVPDPPCGDWGDQPDGIQYFEVHPGAARVLFVRVGQDEPLFDEKTLEILPAKSDDHRQ